VGELSFAARHRGDGVAPTADLPAVTPEREGSTPYLPEPLLWAALQTVQVIRNDEYRAWALGAFAPHVPESLLKFALQIAKSIGDEDNRATAVASLVPHLGQQLQEEALTAFTEVAARVYRWRFLDCVEKFVGVIARLAGIAGIRELRQAVSDTGRWFP
jgi:hypothetical protein